MLHQTGSYTLEKHMNNVSYYCAVLYIIVGEQIKEKPLLVHIHSIPSSAADRANNTERPLKRRRMKLSITPTTLNAALRGLTLVIKLPTDTSNRLFLSRGEREHPATSPAQRGMVIIKDSLVAVLVTDVG